MKNSGVEVILESLESHPHCPHGPTLLFERYTTDGEKTGRRFYACSACRNRSECNFFHWAEEKFTEEHVEYWKSQTDLTKPLFTHKKYVRRLENFRKKPVHQRSFCKTCSSLVFSNETELHKKHDVLGGITDTQLQNPSSLILPLQNNKLEAQYFFSEKTIEFTVNLLKNLGYTRVLSIGAPKIHEFIRTQVTELQSVLLDIDLRYVQFYSKNQFCPYNMFNNYYFGGVDSEKVVEKFLGYDGGNGVVIVIDPPFGGLIDAISHSIQQMSALWGKPSEREKHEQIPVLWFFPYFNESRILDRMPQLAMMDYKVEYANHKTFVCKGGNQGSPIRIFTNIKPSLFVLPKEGYRFCNICDRYVADENHHCSICKACTTKNGKTYKHCDSCERCVKPTYEHCEKCGKCVLAQHDCDVVSKPSACFHCGGLGHKRRDCPSKNSDQKKKKRKLK